MSKYVEVEAIYWDATFNERYVIDNAPSIDIVRCAECKYWTEYSDGDKRCEIYGYKCADDFCSYGEREGE